MDFHLNLTEAKLLREGLITCRKSEQKKELMRRLDAHIELLYVRAKDRFKQRMMEDEWFRQSVVRSFPEDKHPGIGWALRMLPALDVTWWDATQIEFSYRLDGKECRKRVPVGISVDDLRQVLVEDDSGSSGL